MNREQKREQQKNLRKLGIDKRSFDVLVGLQAIKKSTQTIQSGDRVKLNVDAIRNGKDYDRLSDLYRNLLLIMKTMSLRRLLMTALVNMATCFR